MGSAEDFPIGGTVAPGFEAVRDAFKKNFDAGLEHGSAYVAYHDGKCVVNLYGGYQDEQMKVPFTEKSLTTVWSSGKSVLGVTVAHCVSKGLFR
jgi:CubicO group peptidase (beta-lactamase class C family)